MTIEELKKEAEESFEKYIVTDIDYVVSPYSDDEGEKKLMFNNEYDAEEEYFRLYSKGYLAGAEPREKRIEELEAEVKEWKGKADLWCKTANLKDHNIMINKELEKENAELKSLKDVAELIRLNNSSVVTMMQLNNNNVALQKENADLKEEINKIAFARGNLEEENAELEKQLDIVRNERNLFQERSEDILENYYCDHKCKCTELEKENAELKEELKKWKDEWQEQVQKATDEGYARTLQTMQLTKAKELLKRCYDNYICLEPLRSEIALFLSEVEKNEEVQD